MLSPRYPHAHRFFLIWHSNCTLNKCGKRFTEVSPSTTQHNVQQETFMSSMTMDILSVSCFRCSPKLQRFRMPWVAFRFTWPLQAENPTVLSWNNCSKRFLMRFGCGMAIITYFPSCWAPCHVTLTMCVQTRRRHKWCCNKSKPSWNCCVWILLESQVLPPNDHASQVVVRHYSRVVSVLSVLSASIDN